MTVNSPSIASLASLALPVLPGLAQGTRNAATVERTVVIVIVGIAALFALRVVVSLLLALLARMPGHVGALGRRFALRVSPVLARRLVAAVAGSSLALGAMAGPGWAVSPTAGTGVASRPPVAIAAADGRDGVPIPLLNRAVDAAGTTPPGVAQPPAAAPPVPACERGTPPIAAAAVTVRSGDSLWAIAARSLPISATEAEIDREWRRWWRANRSTIGADPNLVVPGQVLSRPASTAQP